MLFLEKTILGNTVSEWIEALIIWCLLAFLFLLVKKILERRFKTLSERRANGIRRSIAEILSSTNIFILLVIAFYFAAVSLELPESANRFITSIAFAAVIIQIGIWGSFLIKKSLEQYAERRTDTRVSNSGIIVMGLFSRIVLWSFVLLMILDNLGVNITTLIASLGIGGIAIGLATQNILSDLFASLSILLDQPFEPGHFIIVGSDMGTVEKIGLKTTRVRSLSGELLIFGNNDLLQSRIRNFTNFQERRIVFTFGVLYSTPVEKLKRIPGMVRDIIENTPNTRFDRAHFKAFGDFSLDYEVVYYVLSPDYVIYMDVQEKINLELFEIFEKEEIEFAFPTRTIHLEGNIPEQERAG